MQKTLRNKVLKDVTRLIKCDFNGETWCSPDGIFATSYPIYDGYRIKKSQYAPEGRPLLHKIISNSAETLAEFEHEKLEHYIDLSSTGTDLTYRINSEYYTFLKQLHPKALPYIATNGDKYEPVRLYEVDKYMTLVALIMPIKQ
jgi:hypothetical protein